MQADGTIGHHDDAVGEQHGFVDIVRDHDRGIAEPAVDLHDAFLQMRPCQRVERAEWLVHQQNLGLHRQRAGDADALLHAARNFRRALVGGMPHLHEREIVHRPFVPLGLALGRAEDFVDRELDVVVDGQPRQQRMALEDDGAVGARRVDFAVLQQDGARRDLRQAGDQVEQRGLAATGMADDGDELALLDRQRDAFQHLGLDAIARERLVDMVDLEEWTAGEQRRRGWCAGAVLREQSWRSP